MKIETRLTITDKDQTNITSKVDTILDLCTELMAPEDRADISSSINMHIGQLVTEYRRQLHVAYKLGLAQGKLESKEIQDNDY